ncbi:MAG: argininosuccinate lyase [Deltaproteobacteria bacterium]|nr:argininosuccinate lyase [Deltaproteobacteria bacterium]
MVKKPWGGRFEGPTDALVEAFTSSIEGDRHIAIDDVEGSLAHARMLQDVGVISTADGEKIAGGLRTIRREIETGTFAWNLALEDVHMNIERRLAALVGDDVAGRLHTARSRNDQVALDVRLFLRRRLRDIVEKLVALEHALIEKAHANIDVIMPGYTHMQRAQPVRLAHHLLAYREMFARDRSRVTDAMKRALVSPLGSGALAGTPHPIDRERVASLLGLGGVTANSMDSVADRDALLEVLSVSAISMIHLSRLSEEIVLFASAEFGFIEIEDAFTTGSSMMPQKKNPDVAELVRGKCGRVVGDLVSLLVTMKGLPMTYNRDMQEDKPPLYDSLDTWAGCLEVTSRMIPAVRFREDRLSNALREGFVTATELADHLVTRGVPFRDAHEVVGRIVGHCVAAKKTLDDLDLEALRRFHPDFGEDALEWIDVQRAVDRRDLIGGPNRARVAAAIDAARQDLEAAFAAGWLTTT